MSHSRDADGPRQPPHQQYPQQQQRRIHQHYTRFTHARVAIRFEHLPPLGWVFDTARKVYCFPRDDQGNLVFDSRYWRGMLGHGLRMFLSDVILERDPHIMMSVRVDPVRQFVAPTPMHRVAGKVYEQLPIHTCLETTVHFPSEVISWDEFCQWIKICGEHVGWAPLHSQEGYGRFEVVSIKPIDPMQGSTPSP